ncbi:sterol carrier family protein [Actinomyces sp.]|uniref:sterol carrier family protein n=1 Tax=Actinomyces sp. TaxID=29317 RepID=UPI00290DF6B2|nr:sterol carrier family protein [Actinomyces sp.]MDU6679324.1 sterol carrier family protein [Actinomyces sp.]
MRQIDDAKGLEAVKQWQEGATARPVVALAVRWSLGKLEKLLPGHAVEVRVPPFGAVQILGGTTHRRGTPPAVVEMNAKTWLELVTGKVVWSEALENGEIAASGQRADLSAHFPLISF